MSDSSPHEEPKPARTAILMGSDDQVPKPINDVPSRNEDQQLAALFPANVASEYRERWVAVQQGFVDDPRRAVQQGDELVTKVMNSLSETFSKERTGLEGQVGESGSASTEMLRLALRRYRSFFERLLSL